MRSLLQGSQSTRLATGAAVFVVALGLTVLAGWFSRVPVLVQVLPHLPPVRGNAAACLVLCGLALLGAARRRPRWLVVTSTGLVSAVTILTLIEYVLAVNIGIDELLGPAYIAPARMPEVSAICFASIALALLLAVTTQSQRSARVVVLVGSIVAAIGVATIMAYALGTSDVYGWHHVTRAPLLTGLGFLAIGLGMLAVAWQADPDPAGIPRWLAISVAIGVATTTVSLWQGLIAGGQPPFALLPGAVLVGGFLLAAILGLTVHLAQRGHSQAAALRRSEAFLAKVQEVSSTGGFYWWPDSGTVYWSEQVYRILEIDPSQPLTSELHQSRLHPDDLRAHREKIRQVLLDPRDYEYELRLLMPNKSIKYIHALVQATRDRDGSLLYVGAIQDVTQRRLSEVALNKVRSELAHAARVMTVGTLTASIAHEINQPLSGIITNASTCLRMLGSDPPNVDGARETARRAIRDGNRVSEIITRLRALYSRKDPPPDQLDLNEAAREVIALSLSDLHRNGVVLRTEFASELPDIIGDRVQLQQVILNLIRNASDAMSGVDDRPRDLLVRTERDDRAGVRLSVQDAGVGFEPDAADRIFGAFYTTKHDGMGMGLSVSRSIIERHHGRLWATPNNGPGATVTFSVPRDFRTCEDEGATPPIPTYHGTSGRKAYPVEWSDVHWSR